MWILLVTFEPLGGRRIRLPLPLFLVWPLLAVPLLVALLIGLLRRPRATCRFIPVGVRVFLGLSGLQVDTRSHEGHNIHVRFI